MDLQLTNYQK